MLDIKEYLRLRSSALDKAGAFWKSNGSTLTKISNAIAGAIPYDSMACSMYLPGASLTGEGMCIGEPTTVTFDPSDINVVGEVANRVLKYTDQAGMTRYVTFATKEATEAALLTDEGYELIVDATVLVGDVNSVDEVSYKVPFADDVHPVSILSSRGLLTAGVDFVAGRSSVTFFEPPTSLFPEGIIYAETTVRTIDNSINGFYAQQSGSVSVSWIRRLQGGTHTMSVIGNAIMESLGLHVIENQDTVASITQTPAGVQYGLASGRYLNINYDHTELPIGKVLRPGDVVHDGARAFVANTPGDWLPAIADGGLVNLDFTLPVDGLRINSELQTIDYVDSNNGVPHVRVHLQEVVPGSLVRWWDTLKDQEERTGSMLHTSLRDYMGVDVTAGDSVLSYAEVLLAHYGPILTVDISKGTYDEEQKSRMLEFVRRERVLRCPIVIIE